MAASDCRMAVLTLACFFSYVVAVALNAILNIPGVSPFNETIGNLSAKYNTSITPTPATFSIWGLIYLWQGALLVYTLTLLCRKAYGKYLYIDPGFIPATFYVAYIIQMLGNPGWIVLFLQELNTPALGMLVLGVVFLTVCLATSCNKLVSCETEMKKKGLLADIWLTRILVQNGIALYLAWVSLATLINAVVVLHYQLDVAMATCCWAALVVLNLVIVAWFVLETFFLDRYLRYVFAHYISYIIAFVGVFKQNYDPAVDFTQYELALLVLVSVLALVKVIVIIVRSVKNPLYKYRSM